MVTHPNVCRVHDLVEGTHDGAPLLALTMELLVGESLADHLSEHAPLPLKQATAMMNVQSRLLASLGQTAGIRTMAHKEARVQFHDPMKIIEAAIPVARAIVNVRLFIILDFCGLGWSCRSGFY